MQYVRSFSGSVSKTWNSLNPATLSGAIDVVVVEQEDGSLACSPFHVRFGKFSLLRPSEKKVEFRVNGEKQEYSMKLGEGGEAFFVFETSDSIPESLQTSPIVSPASSPPHIALQSDQSDEDLQEPEFLDLSAENQSKRRPISAFLDDGSIPMLDRAARAQSDLGNLSPLSGSPPMHEGRPASVDWSGTHLAAAGILERSSSEEIVPLLEKEQFAKFEEARKPLPIPRSSYAEPQLESEDAAQMSSSPPQLSVGDAMSRAKNLSEKLSSSNIPSRVTDTGDLMLDINGYKSNEDDVFRAEVIARKILAEELQGNYDIGALIGADEKGNLWIYSSEEAKEAATRRTRPGDELQRTIDDSASDPGYHSDGDRSADSKEVLPALQQDPSERPAVGLVTPPQTPPEGKTAGDPNRNYAKTLRLTSDQLKALDLKSGPNSMAFSVNRATCQANMYYWRWNVPVVISDIDGTITKSDALGHVLNMIGRDWTHLGVAKLYTDIVANGYNILYLTSRSVGQADTTRAYLEGIVQDGLKLPRGPVILSPDRTMAALRREIYLRKPEVFKMACLRDISHLFGQEPNPFYAGFGNRFTDALSYRSVNIPPNRIFTINSNAEVSLDLLTLNKYNTSYVSMREIVDHFFPPVGLLVKGGGEDFTDFNYWRETPLQLDDFSASESGEDDDSDDGRQSLRSEDEGSEGIDDDQMERMTESIMSRESTATEHGDLVDSILESIEDEEMTRTISYEHSEDGDDEDAEDDGEPENEEHDETPMEKTFSPIEPRSQATVRGRSPNSRPRTAIASEHT